MRRIWISSSAVVLAALTLTASSAAATPSSNLESIKIRNFGEVNPHIYRGARPEGRDYSDLAALGIKTVVDLESGDPTEERQQVEAAGMKFVHIPMSDSATPDQDSVRKFLVLANGTADQPIFVHCRGGRHRTGALIAVYRMTHDRWTAASAYEEMKNFRFNVGFTHAHQPLKKYVLGYSDPQAGRS
jgi:tyrosine-protein phosphatase SIW14